MARRRMSKEQRTRQIILRTTVVAAMAIIGIVVIYATLFMNREEVNLNELTHAKLSGCNGEGTLEAQIDVLIDYSSFFDTVKVSFSQDTGLSNGDEVKVTYEYDKKQARMFNIKVIADTEYITIKDLPEGKDVSMEELFEGANVVFEGIAPLATAKLMVRDTRFGDLVSYQMVSDQQYYGIGDKVVVRAIFDDADMLDEGFKTPCSGDECYKEFVVEGIDRYLTSADDVTDDVLASLQKEALSLFTDANEFGMRIFCDAGLVPVYENKKTTFVWRSPNFLSAYFNVVKDENIEDKTEHINDIKLCYEASISQANGVACQAEVIVRYTDIIERADGSYDLNVESGGIISADRRDKHIKEVVNNSVDPSYESTKL